MLKVGKGSFEELSSNPSSLKPWFDREIGDVPDFRLEVDVSGYIPNDLPVYFGDENPFRVSIHIMIDVCLLPLLPIQACNDAELVFDVLIDRDTLEADGCDLAKCLQI